MDNKKKVTLNNVKSRFLFIPPSVEAGLEAEAKIDDFRITHELGEGSFGRVLKVTHRLTGKVYAIKAIDKRNKTNQQGKPYFRREIEIMYKVHHPNAVRLYTHFEDDNYCYFVMEVVSKGNLYELMQKRKTTLDKGTIIQFMRELISAVYYLHNMEPPIIHRDIKPENILLSENGSVKLTDFGWSNYVDDEVIRSTYCGTPLYLAPEMIKEVGHDEYLDIWCLGILMFELITGSLPFTGKSVESVSGNILKNRIVWPNDINPDEKDLLNKILKTNPTERLSLKGILAHPYFTKVKVHDGFVFYTPKEGFKEEHNDIFLISTGVVDQSNKTSKVKAIDAKEQNINQKFSGSEILPTSTSSSGSNNNELETLRKEVGLYKQRIEKYESYIKDVEESYLLEKNKTKDLTQENQQLIAQVHGLVQNKEILIADLEEKESHKITNLRQISELNEKILEKDNKNKNIVKAYRAMEEKNKYNDEEIKRLQAIIEQNDELIDFLKAEHIEKTNELQKKLLEVMEKDEDKFDTRITLIRDSLNEMATINPVSKYNFGCDKDNSSQDELIKKISLEYEEKIKEIQTKLSEQIKQLQNEIFSERDKFNVLLVEREKEIKKLLEERKSIKDSVVKTYEKGLQKAELTLKIKESEIEKLTTQIKKYEKLNVLKK